jgi:predicted GNAT family acetyltransferase
MAIDDIALADNAAAHRFELRMAGAVVAYSEYNLLKDAVMFTHTEVLPAHEGEGLGSSLARFALDDVRQRGLHVIPVCPVHRRLHSTARRVSGPGHGTKPASLQCLTLVGRNRPIGPITGTFCTPAAS